MDKQTVFSELDQRLQIADQPTRIKALEDLAVSLHLNPVLAKDKSGQTNEEHLVVLIYEAFNNKGIQKQENFQTYTKAGIVAVLVLLVFIFYVPRIFSKFLGAQKELLNSKDSGRIYQGFDREGNPTDDEKKAVTFQVMDGVYYDYFDDTHRVRFEYIYQNGRLIRTKEFDAQGKLISDQQDHG